MKRITAFLICILIICTTLSGCDLPFFREGHKINSQLLTGEIGLRAHFVDVGQGDCILLESQGQFALVDAGEYSQKDTVVSYLCSMGVDNIDYVISTHPHSDHCGSLSEVIRSFDCDVLLTPDTHSESSVFDYVLDAADERGVEVRYAEKGDTYTLGSSSITVLSPDKDSVYSSLNDYSLVCKVEYGNTSLLLTGDAEKVVEDELLREDADLNADVLKCGHHGSSTGNTLPFIMAVNPAAAIITCGKDNDYGHPHKETTETLDILGIPVWRTDRDSTIIMMSDGESISIGSQSKNESLIETLPSLPNEPPYIGNRNTKVFHSTDCTSIKSIKSKNRIEFFTREKAVEYSYSPCKACNP